jgi:hypothetical protein
MSTESRFPCEGLGTRGPLVPTSPADYKLLTIVSDDRFDRAEMSLKLGFDADHADRLLASKPGRAYLDYLLL